MTDGLGTLCIQRMIDKMFIEIDDTVSFIVHINAHRTGNSFYHKKNTVHNNIFDQ